MIAFLTTIVGARAAKPLLYTLGAALVIALLFSLSRCNRDTTAQRQAEQTTRSGDAIANAASVAIDVIGNRVATDQSIDEAVAVAQMEINNADDPDAIRTVILDSVCNTATHRNDPACAVR